VQKRVALPSTLTILQQCEISVTQAPLACSDGAPAGLSQAAELSEFGDGCPADHGAALQWLWASFEAGCRSSALAVGVRMLVGQDCPYDPHRAIQPLAAALGPHAALGAGVTHLTLHCAAAPPAAVVEPAVSHVTNAAQCSDSDSDDDFVVRGQPAGFTAAAVPTAVASPAPVQASHPAAAAATPLPMHETPHAGGHSHSSPLPANNAALYKATLAAASNGDAAAQNDVGVMLHSGASPAGQNNAAAKVWFAKAAAQGSPEAQVNLAFMHVAGSVADTVDLPAAFACLQAAAKAGHAAGMNDFGVMLQNGYGCDADPLAAMMWFHRAASAGNADAMVNAGVALAQGKGCREDPAAAKRMLQQAQQRGHAGAQVAMVELFPHFASPMRLLRFSALDGSAASVSSAMEPGVPSAAGSSPASTNSTGWNSVSSAPVRNPWPRDEEEHILQAVKQGILHNIAIRKVNMPTGNVEQLMDEKQILRNLPWMEIASTMPRRHGTKVNAKKCRAYFENVLARNLGTLALRICVESSRTRVVTPVITMFAPDSSQ